MKISEGLKFDITNHDYHFGFLKNVLGSSGVSKLYRYSPEHFLAYINQEEKDPTPALVFGSAYHVFILEREKFSQKVAIVPEINRRTKAGQAEYKEFLEKHKGKHIIPVVGNSQINGYDKILAMAKTMDRYKTASSIFNNPGVFEQTVVWKDPTFGFWCKARFDFHIQTLRLIIDLKTTMDASEDSFRKSIANMDYDLSAAWYTTGMQNITGHTYQYIWVVQEKDPPYSVALYEADQEILDNGRKKIRPTLEIYDACMRSGEWPGYPDAVRKIQLPGWALV